MFDLYIGTLIPFSSHILPENCVPCDGRTLAIMQYQALFSIIGITYGGNGRDYFKVPDLRGRMPAGAGQAPGMVEYYLGEMGGYEQISLYTTQIPSHTHLGYFSPSNIPSTINIPAHAGLSSESNNPTGKFWGKPEQISLNEVKVYNTEKNTTMNSGAVETTMWNNGQPAGTVSVNNTGGGYPHENMSPYTVINWLMVTDGLYPSFQ